MSDKLGTQEASQNSSNNFLQNLKKTARDTLFSSEMNEAISYALVGLNNQAVAAGMKAASKSFLARKSGNG